jgi:hypothetical protein
MAVGQGGCGFTYCSLTVSNFSCFLKSGSSETNSFGSEVEVTACYNTGVGRSAANRAVESIDHPTERLLPFSDQSD